ncbi:MAG: hypothetical protein BWY78_00981 [Alphaproteobacteria bacterium ADurb.Bin438]|nr:MAG: hypothetical protein BWY78_00981 [Alphaproteobacteria bacterium ADurb.Bin438]
MDQFNPDTLDAMLKMAKDAGINEENTVTVVGRGTLKAVGDSRLTNCEANGVGNDMGFVFDDKVRNQIKEVGQKLSSLMAKAGKVGLAGADMIIDKNGKLYINEINDRQQGPTAQMSKDAENNGLPSLIKASILASYADFGDKQVQETFKTLKKESEAINDAYTLSKGEFYLKVQATHESGKVETVNKNLAPGFYDFVKQKNGEFKLDYSSYKSPETKVDYQTNPSKEVVTVKLEGGDYKKGDKVKGGQQLIRLTGVADKSNPPFIIENGKTVLSSDFEKVVKACYEHMFYKGYMDNNPLLARQEQEKEIKAKKKNLALAFLKIKAAKER